MMQPFSDKERVEKLKREGKCAPKNMVVPSTQKQSQLSTVKTKGGKKSFGEYRRIYIYGKHYGMVVSWTLSRTC